MREFIGAAIAPLLSASVMAQTFVITNVTVIDGSGSPPRLASVTVDDGRIRAIGQGARVPTGARVVDGTGKFLIPGLWDSHVHLILADTGTLQVFLANGVTGLREMGGDVARTARWRAAIESGRMLGPRLFYSGPILENARYFENLRNMEAELGSGFFGMMERTRIAVGNPEDARRAVDSIARLGAHFIKVRTSTNRASSLAILAEAKRVGLRVVGHAPDGASPGELAAAGFASVEHGFNPSLYGFLAHERATMLAAMSRGGALLTPTMVSGWQARMVPDSVGLTIIADSANRIDDRRRYVSDEMLAYWRRFYSMKRFESPVDWQTNWTHFVRDIAEADAAGVRFLAGTDLGVTLIFPGFALHDELALLVNEAKLAPMRALQAATRNAAEFMGVGDSLGTIVVGKVADLVLLDANPLSDIRTTRRIAAVVARGKFYDRLGLDSMLAAGARVARGGTR